MEYQLVLSPDIDLSPTDILAAWEADAQAKTLAAAKIVAPTVKSFDPALVAGVVAFATTVGTGVLTNMLSDVLMAALMKKFGGKHTRKHLKMTELQQPDGTRLLVVEQEEKV
jgi:hypothetical protein